jgi:hypothetical protein
MQYPHRSGGADARRYGWHGFRRGVASNLYELGADENIVQRALRHAKSHVTRDRFIKAFDPAVLAAMQLPESSGASRFRLGDMPPIVSERRSIRRLL